MYNFTSPLTHNKLKLHKKTFIPEFEYSSYTQIDPIYKDFCKQSRRSLSQGRKSQSFQTKPLEKERIPSETLETEDLLNLKSAKLGFLKNKITDFLSKQKKTKASPVSPILEIFGNTVIAAIFNSLIIKSVEEVHGIQVENPLTFSNRVLENFGISSIQLKALKTPEERNRFILENMNSTIERLLKYWAEKLETQERHHTQAEEAYEIRKKDHFNDCKDKFKWLVVKTKYHALQKKLKNLIVQKLNDYENQVKVIEMLHQRENCRASNKKIASTDLKLTLNNINSPLTTDMLKTSIIDPDILTIQRTLSSPRIPKSLLQDPKATISFNLKDKRALSLKNFAQKNRFYEWKLNKTSERPVIAIKKAQDNKETTPFELTWDENLESLFMKSKKQAKSLLIHEKNNGKWNKLAFKSIVQRIFTEEQKNNEKSQLLKLYSEGGQLSTDELRFLSDTSELLNSCIDKKFFQKAVNIIEPNILSLMELNLAEQVIKQHKSMEEIVILARNSYYKAKNELITSKISLIDGLKAKEGDLKRNKEELIKKQRVYNNVMWSIERKRREKIKEKEVRLYEDINRNKTYSDYQKEALGEIKDKVMGRLELKKRLLEGKNQISFDNCNHPSVVKHRYHPSSKLFYFDKKEIDEKKDSEWLLKSMKKNEEDYKICVTSPQILKMPQYFRAFYSGGPLTKPNNEDNIHTAIITDPLLKKSLQKAQLRSALKIQSLFRGFSERKKHKERIEEKIKQNFVEMSEKVSYFRDLSIDEKFNSKSFHSGFSFQVNSSNKTHYKTNSMSTEPSRRSLSFKITKLQGKSVKIEELFQNSKKIMSFDTNLAFCYSKKELNIKDSCRNTPLYYAAKNSNKDFCNYLLENGGNPDEICSFGDTPFHIAMRNNKSEIIGLFLIFQPDFSIRNESNQSPLDCCNNRTIEVFNLKREELSKNKKFENSVRKQQTTILNTEKSLLSNSSDGKIRKTLCFKKDLVEVI